MTTAETTSPSIDELAGSPPAYAPALRLARKVCLVVGATSGIGRATALRMAEEGAAAVVVSGRRQALGQDLAEALCRIGSESLFVTADVTCEADLSGLVERTMTRFGRLDAAFQQCWIPGATGTACRPNG